VGQGGVESSSCSGANVFEDHVLMKKEGMFCRHSSSLQPHLTEQHMAARFAYALDEVHPVQGPDGCYRFKDMYDRVDVDEKWFYLTRKSEAYILIAANDEDDEGEWSN
jgi:hypothetical protein